MTVSYRLSGLANNIPSRSLPLCRCRLELLLSRFAFCAHIRRQCETIQEGVLGSMNCCCRMDAMCAEHVKGGLRDVQPKTSRFALIGWGFDVDCVDDGLVPTKRYEEEVGR